MSEPKNVVTEIRTDLAAVRAVLASDAAMTAPVLHGLWRWFKDVELMVPLPVMGLAADERRSLAIDIAAEMDAKFVELEKVSAALSVEEQSELGHSLEAEPTNNLWRELAGCYAELINLAVAVLPDEARQEIQRHMFDSLSRKSGDPDLIRFQLRTDSVLRMSLRMSGLDPDQMARLED
jgi:hypothetical protein